MRNNPLSYLGWCTAFAFLFVNSSQAENPHWIWNDNKGVAIQTNEVRFFRKTFHLPDKPAKALLSAAADDKAVVYVNGKEVAQPKDYSRPAYEDVTDQLKRGQNVIAIRGHNIGGDVAGVLVMLELKLNKKNSEYVMTDASWLSSDKDEAGWQNAGFNDSSWRKATSRGKLGDQPWGDVLKVPKATAAESLTVLPGFKVELLHSSEAGEGSWICMATDSRGRLIISPQADNQPLLRINLSRAGQVTTIEKVPAPVRQAMGMLYAHDSLYVNGHGPSGTGLYRLIDANHNDQFDTNEVHFLKTVKGEGEHGYHGLVLGPDGMIYMMNGNHTRLPDGLAKDSPHTHYEEDLLLPRQWDAGGHAVGILAPGGHILRTDPEGKRWELILAGFRNSYDFDFSANGEIFTFDSDMEWDWGMPWYRPIRIIHCVSGGEYGWRSGSAKWPVYYPDSLPPAVDIGVGSPTGVKFGTKSNFPEKYQQALYALDWSYGRIFAVHLKPQGATYTADYEVFVKGKPLNVTDVEFGKDGAMYFITGGRGTQSGLYRVSYTGREQQKTRVPPANVKDIEARAIRRQLESFYGHKDLFALDYAWPYLSSPDRSLRYAARIAIEWQDVAQWKGRALAETNVDAGLTALLALARCGGKETQRDLLLALRKFPLDSLSLERQLDKLRVIELSFIRQGKPESDLARLAIEKLNQHYPADNEFLNRELSQLLIFLEAPDVVTKTLALLDKAPTQEEQAHYIFCLRNLKSGWTLAQRRHYFEWLRFAQAAARGETNYPPDDLVWTKQKKPSDRHPPELLRWFKEADREYSDGASYPKFLVNFRKDAIAALPEQDRFALSDLIDEGGGRTGYHAMKERHFVQEWTLADLEPLLDQVSQGRTFSRGKDAFNDAQCILCHRFGNDGGFVGPELTAASSKYTRRDILESILDPSKVISEQYQNYVIVKKDGDGVIGRIVDEDDQRIVVASNPLGGDNEEVKKSEIAERRPGKVSPMPEGLLNQLTKDEILDLLAYIESAGKEKASNFKPLEAAAAKQ